MTTSGQSDRIPLPEAAQGARPKPTLGPPHDTYATLVLTLAVAGAFFFTGRFRGEGDALGWVGMLASLAVAVAAVFYVQRAYGFASRRRGNVPRGAVVAGVFGFMYVQQFVPAALYEQYFHASLLAYSVSCLALAALPVAVLRAVLGKASSQEQTDEAVPGCGTADNEMGRTPEE